MELMKETQKYMEVISSGNERISVEGDVIVPDVKPDVLKVLQVDAVSVITDKGITSGGIYIEGKLKVNILYIPENDDECTGCIKANFEFRDRLDVPLAENDIKFNISSEVKRIEFTLLNSRKLSVKANVGIDYELIGEKEMEIPCGFDGETGECLTESVAVGRIVADETCDFIINDSTELSSGKPSIKEILKTDAKIYGKEIKAVYGKLITKGIVGMSVLYKTADNGIDFCEAEFPFTEVFDVYDINEEDSCAVDLDICDVNTELCEDSDGDMRIINFECQVSASVRGERQNSIEIISDCYFPGMETNVKYKTENIKSCAANIKEQKSIKEIIGIDEKLPQIVKIYNVLSEAEVLKTEIGDNRINVEGKLKVYVIYLTDNKKCAVYTFRKDIPVSYSFNCENCCDDAVAKTKMTVDHISYNINSMGEIELRCIIDFDIKLLRNASVDLICEIETEPKCKDSDIIIYFVKKGDSLWSIGKKYAVKASEIGEINSLEDDTIFPGQKLLIPPSSY